MLQKTIDTDQIPHLIDEKKSLIKLSLSACARCSLCAESCFLFQLKEEDPRYMPSHKLINSIGKIYKKKNRITHEELLEIRDIVWNRCVLCTRCYCPLGVDIPRMIALSRQILRTVGVAPTWDETSSGDN